VAEEGYSRMRCDH